MRLRWVIVLVLAMLAPAARAERVTARILKADKRVEVQRGGGDWVEARAGQELAEGDQIHTGFKATAVLEFRDRSVVTVKPMTMLRLQRAELDGTTVRTQVQLRLGEIKAKVGHSTNLSSDLKVKTATCTASVRGTVIDRISYTPALGTQIAMGDSGRLQVSSAHGSVMLGTSQSSSIPSATSAPTSAGETQRLLDANLEPTSGGLTDAEVDTLDSVGVPKSAPLTEGGADAVDNGVDEIERVDPDDDPDVPDELEAADGGAGDNLTDVGIGEAEDTNGDGVVDAVNGVDIDTGELVSDTSDAANDSGDESLDADADPDGISALARRGAALRPAERGAAFAGGTAARPELLSGFLVNSGVAGGAGFASAAVVDGGTAPFRGLSANSTTVAGAQLPGR